VAQHDTKIYIAGSTGMVGSAIIRRLNELGHSNLVGPSSGELDLTNQRTTDEFFENERPRIVIHAAGKVGGIVANNTQRADFIYRNLMMEANVIHASQRSGVEKLIFLGSSCIYPKMAAQPIKEEALLSGPLEPTNEPYAVAKIAAIKLCESYFRQYGCNFFSMMPTNLYGPNDNYDLESSHVVPALIRKFHEATTGGAQTVTVWGSGRPLRDLLYVDDLANAVVFLMENCDAADIYGQEISHLNIGYGSDVSIADLAKLVGKTVGFTGDIRFDGSRPDGTPRKLLDNLRINALGWKPNTDLSDGLRLTYQDFLRTSASSVAA
jgi:GDP-L-fucose synthase